MILAWLALWRPAEALLYGWVPYYRKHRGYERLARIHVAVRLGASNATDTGHSKSLAIPPVTAEGVPHSARTGESARPVGS